MESRAAAGQEEGVSKQDEPFTHYECHNGQIWVKTMEDEEMLFKFYDANIKEEKEVKKINDE